MENSLLSSNSAFHWLQLVFKFKDEEELNQRVLIIHLIFYLINYTLIILLINLFNHI